MLGMHFIRVRQPSDDAFISETRTITKMKGGKEIPAETCGGITLLLNFKADPKQAS